MSNLEHGDLGRGPSASLPLEPYQAMAPEELRRRIQAVRTAMGRELLILGHHYQQDDVIALSDLRGDSYQLSRQAAQQEQCRAIVFCGVHFMAETADILANRPEQRARRDGRSAPVILPDLEAGCSMADMASLDQVEECWEQLAQAIDPEEITPVTYVNSTADLKAFCGRHGGIVCTSANADKVLRWALARRPRVLFFPDQHLGRNTALAMGIPLAEMPLWDPACDELGGCSREAIRSAKVILWQGYCSVHQVFQPQHIELFRQKVPGIKILVHPECCREVVALADSIGSTGKILREVEQAPPGTRWAIGTEIHLVERLKHEHPEQEIHFLSPIACMCSTMYRIDLPHLCWAVENLAAGTPVNVIHVDQSTARFALESLERMLEVTG